MVQQEKHEFLLLSKLPTSSESCFLIGKTETRKTIVHKKISYAPAHLNFLRSDDPEKREPWELLAWKLAMRLILGTQYHWSGVSKDKSKYRKHTDIKMTSIS